MFIRSALFLLVSLLTLPAFAESLDQIKTCNLSGHIRLERAMQIYCDGDMNVEDGTEIITEGHELQIWVAGKAYFGNSKGFQVRSYDESSVSADQPASGSNVLVYATTASGLLRIDSQGLTNADVGGDIELEYGSTRDYDHELFTGRAASAELVRNGELIALEGPGLKPAN